MRIAYCMILCLILPPLYSESANKLGALKCSLSKVSAKDTLTIELPQKHGADLAIVDPNQKYWFISFSQPNPNSKLIPIIPSKEFQTTTKISKNVSDYMGVLWERNKDFKPQKIFTKPGKYVVKLAPSLETDVPEIEGECTLDFTGN